MLHAAAIGMQSLRSWMCKAYDVVNQIEFSVQFLWFLRTAAWWSLWFYQCNTGRFPSTSSFCTMYYNRHVDRIRDGKKVFSAHHSLAVNMVPLHIKSTDTTALSSHSCRWSTRPLYYPFNFLKYGLWLLASAATTCLCLLPSYFLSSCTRRPRRGCCRPSTCASTCLPLLWVWYTIPFELVIGAECTN